MADAPSIFTTHEDADLFREVLRFTAARTGFVARLIEKDYFCTLLLAHLTAADPRLVFKGGTCLAKVHAGFFRLSEDLDFAISLPVTASRSERRRHAEGIKDAVASIPRAMGCFQIAEPLLGANDSAQYNGTIRYTSLLGGGAETIKVEVSLREPILLPAEACPACTILLDPIGGEAMMPPVKVPCLALLEAMAEKFRAALTRREVAIRDFFDLDHAITALSIKPGAPELVELVRRKLAIPGNDALVVSDERLVLLRAQLDARLRPVLRPRDFADFDLERAYGAAKMMAKAVAAP